MPYRCRGTWVEKQESDGKWVKWKQQTSVAKCKAQATAMNMRHAGLPKEEEEEKKSK